MIKSKKIAFVSLGCPKALVDSEKIITKLRALGYQIVDDFKIANLVIVNTCGFINDAIAESLEHIKTAIQKNGKVIVTGCLGAKKEIILGKFPQVLEITGPNSANEVVALVQKHLPLANKFVERPYTGVANKKLKDAHVERLYNKQRHQQSVKLTPPHYAYLKISEGCNQKCSYCIIPDLRGKLVSRPLPEIIQEAKSLIKNGVKELLIISQDTGAYGTDLKGTANETNFLELCTALAKLKVWVRLHYLYPYSYIDEVLPLMAKEKIVPYLDVPLQHINQRILKLMHRPGSKENILRRIKLWREICPEITIRSTFIIGFPGETEAEFQELLDFLAEAKLDRVGCFKYSEVDGAKANLLPNKISEKIKEERFHKLMSLQQKISAAKLAQKVGKRIKVIIDEFTAKYAVGRSYADSPDIDGVVFINNALNKGLKAGDIVEVAVEKSDNYDLYAGNHSRPLM